jgi:hypothetical protein
MDISKIDRAWPNFLRWFLVQNLQSFTPWHFIEDKDDFIFAAKAFAREDIHNGNVFVFASRQDNDDFAGLEILDGIITSKVIVFHPVFSTEPSQRRWNIVNAIFSDVFDFVSNQVIPDMKDWSIDEDAFDL